MSFVSIIASPNFITVMSDGQVTRDGVVIKDDYPKFKKISPKQFIAYTGVKEYCEEIVNQVPYTPKMYNLADITNQIERVVIDPNLVKHKLHFGIGGVDVNEDVVFYTVENQKERIVNYFKPKNIDDINYAFFESGHANIQINLSIKLIEYLRTTGFNTPSKCLKAQKLLNDFVASKDETVNNKTFYLSIKK